MSAFLRWMARREIAAAQLAGFIDGVEAAARSIRNIAAKEGPGREKQRDVLLAAADGLDDTVKECRP